MQPINVLLVDGDSTYQGDIGPMLKKADDRYALDSVSGYQQGMAHILHETHDVYLVDSHLKGGNITDLLRHAADSGRPVIILGSQPTANEDLDLLRNGAADYIPQDELDTSTLTRAIRYALEREHAIHARRESEALFRSLIEEAFDGILITDNRGSILLANKRLAQMLGTDEASLIRRNVHDLITLNSGVEVITDVGSGILTNGTMTHSQGRTIAVEISGKQISGQRIQYIMRDVTTREETLKALERYVERLTIMQQVDDELSEELNIEYVLSLALDATVRLSGADAGFIGLLEDEKMEISREIGPYTRLRDEVFLSELPLVQQLIQDQEPRLILNVEEESDYVAINESTEAQMLLPLMASEKLIGVLNLETSKPERFSQETFDFLKLIASRVAVAIENASLYKIAQDRYEELQSLYAQLSELERLKTDMIRIAAHDIRNPLSVIMGYAELLQMTANKGDIPENATRYIDMIERSVTRLQQITTDVLSLERIENLQANTETAHDMSTTVREVVHEFQGQAQLKSQQLALKGADVPCTVRADEAQIREATVNLISNAIKYTSEGGQITVDLQTADDMAAFRVIDTGYGIPEDEQEALFQPFHRVQTEQTATIEGTGLGLYLIKSIVDRYGGEIIFHSIYGKGSTFGFRLPLADPA